MPRAAFISFRFGPTDGVSVITRHWRSAFSYLGFDTTTVAAEGAERIVAGLGIGENGPDIKELRAALEDCDLVVVENLATIPLNLSAALAVGDVLRGRPAIMHHHDPPWHREQFQNVTELPLVDSSWVHVTINDTTRSEMADRGVQSTRIFNGFPLAKPGNRNGVRATLGVAEDELMFAHPVRAIERKNIPQALAVCEELGATYWLLGPAEDGYYSTLDEILSKAQTRVIRHAWSDTDDIYAAADLVVYPSIWEGFGNPPIEAALREKGCVVGDYPFAGELREMGFEFLSPNDVGSIQRWLDSPDTAALTHNKELATEQFSLSVLTTNISKLLADAGWLP